MMTPKKTNKMIVCVHLISNGVSVDELLEATVSNLDTKGFIFGDKLVPVEGEVFTALAKYVQMLPNANILFPGKAGRQSSANFLLSLQGFLKEQGKTLADIGISSAYTPRQEVKLQSMLDVRQYLESKLKTPDPTLFIEEKPKKHKTA
jgi:hypothetical protein